MTLRFGSLLLAAALLGGCGPSAPAAESASRHRRATPKTPPAEGIVALHSTEIARVPDGTYGPYVGESNRGSVLVWAAAEQEARGWHTLPVGADGTPIGAARRIADAPPEIGLVVVRGGPDADELAIASTRRTGLGEWVEVTLVRANGELVKPPRALVELATRALWVEVVSLGERRLVAWAVQQGDDAELKGVVLGANGEPEGDPRALITAGVRAWQLVPFAGGAALGVVRPDGAVELTLLSPRGEARSKPVVVSAPGRTELDLDLAVAGESLILAWSDRRDGESRVYRAVVGADAAIKVAAGPITTPLGEQALVRLVARPGGARAFAAWETPAEREAGVRAFEVVALDATGRPSADRGRVLLDSEEGVVPEFAATGDGVAALTLGAVCERKATCPDADVLPTFVRFGPKLEVQASEPFRLDALRGEPAELGFGLACGRDQCFALAALGQAPAPVFSVKLERRSDAWKPAARRLGAEERPYIRENRVLATSDALADVTLARVGKGALAASLTDFDPTTPWVKLKTPAADGRFEPLRARLDLFPLKDETGGGLAAPVMLSARAHSLGGIALSPGTGTGDVLVAWTGFDLGQPQVFLTLVGADGVRRSQRMLTRKSGDASDVAAASLAGGWLVAWVDERDKDPELYATRVDQKLTRIGQEQRLTKAPGPATQVTLAPIGDFAVVAWAEARDPQAPGEADIYLRRIASRDATPQGNERPVLATRGHSFAPVLEPLGDGLLLAWLERGTEDAPGSSAIVMALLDSTGAERDAPRRFPLEGGEPGALAVDCVGERCHVVLTLRSGDLAAVHAGVVTADLSAFAPRRLASLGSRAAAGVPLGLEGSELVYSDGDTEGRWKLRRALIDWP